MYIDDFGSRRKGRLWVERNWPSHVAVRLSRSETISRSAVDWAKDKPIYHDNTYRRWWFRDRDIALQFKLMFGGKID